MTHNTKFDDRTKPHPLYEIEGCEPGPIGAFASGLNNGSELYGDHSDIQSAVAATWKHADAVRKEGYYDGFVDAMVLMLGKSEDASRENV